jgi:hypothetical protein
MTGRIIRFSVLILFLFQASVSVAQFSVGLSIGGFAIHHGDSRNAEIYPKKLDKQGRLVPFAGISLMVSYRINKYIGLKAVQSLILYDSAGKRAGISHIGIELHDDIIGMDINNVQSSMSLGPFWYYRKGWSEIASYQNDPEFIQLSVNKKWERKFVWYGGFMRYNFDLGDKNAVAIDFLPGIPHLYAFSAGWNKNL